MRIRCSSRSGLLATVLIGDERRVLGRAGQTRLHLLAVADHADVKVVAHAVRLGALQDEVLQQPVDGVGDPFRLLLARLTAERLVHRRRLVDQEQQAGGLVRLISAVKAMRLHSA